MNRLSLNSNGNSGTGNATPSSSGGNQAQGSNSVPSLLGNPPSSQSSRLGDAPNMLGGYATGGLSDTDSSSLLQQLTQTLARSQKGNSGGDMYGPVGSKDVGNAAASGGNLNSLFGGSSLFGSGGGYGQDSEYGNGMQQGGSNSPEPQENQEIEIAENLAGAIIGQQGRGITELQQMSGATVSVSRKGVYAPGTNNRIVSVSGPQSAVARAAQLVRQRIQEAELRRSSQHSY